MGMRIKAISLAAIFLVLLSVLAQSCRRGSAEDEIRAVVYGARDAATEKDVKGVMKYISDDYRDDEGNDRDAIKGIVFYQFMRAPKLSVFISSIDVQVKGDDAIADVKTVLVAGKTINEIKDIVPDDAAGYLFTIVFKKEAGSWKAKNGRWRNIGVSGLL